METEFGIVLGEELGTRVFKEVRLILVNQAQFTTGN